MKRILPVLVCLMLVLCSCGGKQNTEQAAESPLATQEAVAEKPQETDGDAPLTPTQTLAPSDNKEVVEDNKAPTVYWTMDVAYHLETCPELSKKDNTQVTWQMVKEVGLRQCPICNPPRYEDYIEQ